VSCWVNSYNKRNPYRVLLVSHETAVVNTEEGGDDVKSAWPSDALGDTHVTMGSNKGSLRRKALANPIQTFPQFRLESATRLHEAGIASNRGSAIPR